MTGIITGRKGCGKTFLAMGLIAGQNNLIIYDLNDEYKTGEIFYTLREMEQALINKKFPFRVCLTEEETELSFILLDKYKNLFLCIDEFHEFVKRTKRKSNLFKLIRLQRHRNITCIGISQRIADIHPDIFSQTDWLISFRQTELRDLETLDKLGVNIEEIKALPERKYLIKRF